MVVGICTSVGTDKAELTSSPSNSFFSSLFLTRGISIKELTLLTPSRAFHSSSSLVGAGAAAFRSPLFVDTEMHGTALSRRGGWCLGLEEVVVGGSGLKNKQMTAQSSILQPGNLIPHA